MTETTSTREAPGASAAKTPLRVLSLEDDSADSLLERAVLAQGGYDAVIERVDNAAGFAAALEPGEHDVVFLDYTVPGWGGREALLLAGERCPDVPVIFVAGTIGEETAVELVHLRAADYVFKSRLGRLPTAVGRALENAEAHRLQRRAEDELRASEDRFRRIVETANEGVVVVDADFRVTFCNERIAEMAGTTIARIIGRPASAWLPDGGLSAEQIARRRSGQTSRYEQLFRHADGTHRWTLISASPIFDAHGAFAGSLAMLTDISEIKEAELRLRKAVDGTARAMAALVETRDPYTAGHERRVAQLVEALAAELGWDADTRHGMRLTAEMHDIGKISVPAEILSRPGRLSAVEFAIVQGHSQAAHDILQEIDFAFPVADVILQHHERLDGSGYPAGLRGDEIMPEARILAVADVVEAMASHRPYRAALGTEAALGEIQAHAGNLYDVDAAAACGRLFAAGFEFAG
jgi:PAS domain S-box-containing protein